MHLPARLIAYGFVATALAGCTLAPPIPVVITTVPAQSATLVGQEQDSGERHTCTLPCTVEIHTEKDYAIDVTADGYLPASVTLYYLMAEGTRRRQGGHEAHLVIPLFATSAR
jgi:hypothetical protein